MSAPQTSSVRRLSNGWLVHYWAKIGHEQREFSYSAGDLATVAHFIADAHGLSHPTHVPLFAAPLSPLAERAIAAAEHEDDAVGDMVLPPCDRTGD
jgi:hypothetical protein